MSVSPARLLSLRSLARVDARLDQEIEVGEAAGNAICLADPGVAPHHARILPSNGRWMVQPSTESQPTFLNGDRISGLEPLAHLDVLSFGEVDLVFLDRPQPAAQPRSEPAQAPPAPARAPLQVEVPRSPGAEETVFSPLHESPAPPNVPDQSPGRVVGDGTFFNPLAQAPTPPPMPKAGGAPTPADDANPLTAFSPVAGAPTPPPFTMSPQAHAVADSAGLPGDSLVPGGIRLSGSEGTWTLKPGRNTVGRSPDCDVFVNLRQVSREHAVLIVGTHVVVEDLRGQNGTTVNGTEVVGSMAVKSGDRLAFAGVEFTLEMLRADQ